MGPVGFVPDRGRRSSGGFRAGFRGKGVRSSESRGRTEPKQGLAPAGAVGTSRTADEVPLWSPPPRKRVPNGPHSWPRPMLAATASDLTGTADAA